MGGYLILVIDDEPLQRIILEEHLTLAGYKVTQAENGLQGLEMMKKKTPDLILLDVQMPEMNGFQTLNIIRNNNKFRDIPVLFLTGQESEQQKVRGLELGADDYITKPFHKEELLARIKAIFRRIERYHQKPEGMQGDLSNISLSDLLLSMELGEKTATICIEALDGEIFIQDGEMVYVRQKNITGTGALLRIFLFEYGRFFIRFGELPENIPRIPRSLRFTLISILSHLELGTEAYVTKAINREKVIQRIKSTLRRTNYQRGVEGIMEGDLVNISLADLLQSMEMGVKTASISLYDIDGEIFVQNGLLALARQGIFTGEQAVKRIFLLEKGRFSVRFDELPAKIDEKPKQITSVLMHTMSEIDEIRSIIRRIRGENVRLQISDDISDFPTIEKFKGSPPIPFIELLVSMEGKLTNNLLAIIKAVKMGKLKSA